MNKRINENKRIPVWEKSVAKDTKNDSKSTKIAD